MQLPFIKICGIRNPVLAHDAVRLGARYIGILTHPQSKRCVDLNTAKKIATATKSAGGIPVAVFVDANADAMKSFCDACQIDTVQLHGTIARSDHYLLPKHIKRIYVLSVSETGTVYGDVDRGLVHLQKNRDFLLFDSVRGGSGIAFQHEYFSKITDFPYFLAGGLTSDNVGTAIICTAPFAVDVSSGVEREPGVKDKILMANFIRAVNQCIK